MRVYPKIIKLIHINISKEIFLRNLRLLVANPVRIRLQIKNQKKFEGIVNEEKINIRLIGGLKRVYRVEVLGHFLNKGGKLYLRLELQLKKFVVVYLGIWSFLLLIVVIISLNLFISSGEVLILLFVFLPLLFIVVGLSFNYLAYKNEAYEIIEMLRNLSEDDIS